MADCLTFLGTSAATAIGPKGIPIKSTDPRKPAIVAAIKRHAGVGGEPCNKVTDVRQTKAGHFAAHALRYDASTGKYESLGIYEIGIEFYCQKGA